MNSWQNFLSTSSIVIFSRPISVSMRMDVFICASSFLPRFFCLSLYVCNQSVRRTLGLSSVVLMPASPFVIAMIRCDLMALAATIVAWFRLRASPSVSGMMYIFKYSYERLPSLYISKYRLLFPLLRFFILSRIGSLSFDDFLFLAIAFPLIDFVVQRY